MLQMFEAIISYNLYLNKIKKFIHIINPYKKLVIINFIAAHVVLCNYFSCYKLKYVNMLNRKLDFLFKKFTSITPKI